MTKIHYLFLLHFSVEALSGQPAADYEVGQVSGSLFKKKSAASGSLSTLFSTAAPTGAVLFQPPPKVTHRQTFKERPSNQRFSDNVTLR